jgi:hypothetical protein
VEFSQGGEFIFDKPSLFSLNFPHKTIPVARIPKKYKSHYFREFLKMSFLILIGYFLSAYWSTHCYDKHVQ